MSRALFFTVFTSLCFACSTTLQGAIVFFEFTGTITSVISNDPDNPSAIFGAIVAPGDPVSGYFSLDTTAPVVGSEDGITGSGTAYGQNQPFRIFLEMGGVPFESDGLFIATVVNDFFNTTGGTPIDGFGVSDGVETGPDLSGTTILVNGEVKSGWINLQFIDSTATAFDSTAIPTSLNLSDFNFAGGRVGGTEPSGQINPFFYSATFSIDSMQVTAIPEPSLTLLGSVVVLGMVVRGRRRSRQESLR